MAQVLASSDLNLSARTPPQPLRVEHETRNEPAPGRVASLDNARFLLITLVVFGHALQPLASTSTAVEVAYTWIYLFHMPAFVVLCGLVVRDTRLDPVGAGRIITGLLVPLLIFEVLYRGIDGVTNWKPAALEHGLNEPSWGLWFLLALAAWRFCVPGLAALRYPVVVCLSAAVGLSATISLTRDFSVGRIIMLLPFFAAGLMLKPVHLKRLADPRLRALAVLVLLAAVPVAGVISQQLRRSAILWTGQGNGQGWDGAAVQVGLYAVAGAMIVAFLSLVPRGSHRWTSRGSRSLYVYLLHLLPILLLRDFLEGSSLPLMVLVSIAAAAAVALSLALSSDVVARAARPLVAPRVPWLLARSSVHQ